MQSIPEESAAVVPVAAPAVVADALVGAGGVEHTTMGGTEAFATGVAYAQPTSMGPQMQSVVSGVGSAVPPPLPLGVGAVSPVRGHPVVGAVSPAVGVTNVRASLSGDGSVDEVDRLRRMEAAQVTMTRGAMGIPVTPHTGANRELAMTPGMRRSGLWEMRTPYPSAEVSRSAGGQVMQTKVYGSRDIPCLSEFVDKKTGTLDARDWLDLFEAHAQRNGWSDQTRLVWVGKGLEKHDGARQWHAQWLTLTEHMSYEHWRDSFTQHFADTPTVRRAARLAWQTLTKREDETVEAYYARFLRVQRKAVEEGRMDTAREEEEACAKFVEGLTADLLVTVAVPGPNDTLRSKYQQAALAESWLRSRKKPTPTRAGRVGGVEEAPVAPVAPAAPPATAPAKSAPSRGQERKQQEKPAAPKTLSWSEICLSCPRDGTPHARATCKVPRGQPKCYRCGELGHFASACRVPQPEMKCTRCHSTGHLVKACRRAVNEGAKEAPARG